MHDDVDVVGGGGFAWRYFLANDRAMRHANTVITIFWLTSTMSS